MVYWGVVVAVTVSAITDNVTRHKSNLEVNTLAVFDFIIVDITLIFKLPKWGAV